MIRRLIRVFYAKCAKPILFSFAPDSVHARTIQLASGCQKSLAILSMFRRMIAYDDVILSQRVAGLEFGNPIGLSAGFDKNVQLPPFIKALGFGFMVGGSVTGRPCVGNVRPWFYRVPKHKSLVVNAGLGNEGCRKIAERVSRYDMQMFENFPLFISVAPTNSKQVRTADAAVDDYVQTVLCMRDYAKAIELNISCPNTYGGEPFTSPQMLEKLLIAIDSLKLQQSVFIKMPHDVEWAEFQELLEVITQHEVAGVTVSNLRKDRTELDIPKGVKGGLSGKPTWEKSNEMITKTYEQYGDRLVIIGVGGVFSAKDAYTKIKLGASLVGLITGMIYEGPQLIGDINAELARLLRADGYMNIAEAVGADVKKRTIE